MSANVYTRIAERYQVPADDEAVERFFLDVAPTLSREEREAIVAELQASESNAAETSATTDVPGDVPTFSIDEAPPVAGTGSMAQLVGELSAEFEKRVRDQLDDLFARVLSRLQQGGPAARVRMLSDLQDLALTAGSLIVQADIRDNVRNVARRMMDANVEVVAVLDQERLVGVLSEHDVLVRVVAEGLDPDDTTVAAVMTPVN